MGKRNWPENWCMIRDLWRDWDPNTAEANLFAEKLSNLNQDWLHHAIRDAKTESNWREPKLKQILTEFRKFKTDAGYEVQAVRCREDAQKRLDWAREAAKTNLAVRMILDGMESLSDDAKAALTDRCRELVQSRHESVQRLVNKALDEGELTKPVVLPEMIEAWREIIGGRISAAEMETETRRVLGGDSEVNYIQQLLESTPTKTGA